MLLPIMPHKTRILCTIIHIIISQFSWQVNLFSRKSVIPEILPQISYSGEVLQFFSVLLY